MAEEIIVYWRDIPTQVNFRRGRSKGKALLAERFQEAVDRAAMRAGMAGTDDYVEQWRRVSTSVDVAGDMNEAARAKVAELEAAFPDDVLDALVSAGGSHGDQS